MRARTPNTNIPNYKTQRPLIPRFQPVRLSKGQETQEVLEYKSEDHALSARQHRPRHVHFQHPWGPYQECQDQKEALLLSVQKLASRKTERYKSGFQIQTSRFQICIYDMNL